MQIERENGIVDFLKITLQIAFLFYQQSTDRPIYSATSFFLKVV